LTTKNHIFTGAVNAAHIAPAQVVKSLNGLKDDINLVAGSNITLATNSNQIQISSSTAGGGLWSLTGNTGTSAGVNFLGTTDNQALQFKVNGQRALRLQPATSSPNLIGGYVGNSVGSDVIGATITGGGSPAIPPLPFAYPNVISANYGSILGGMGNSVSGYAGTVSGGAHNSAEGDYSFAAGRFAEAAHAGSFVWADATGDTLTSTADNQFVIRAAGGVDLANNTELTWASSGKSKLSSDQGGSIELGDSLYGGAPYIDFHASWIEEEDYNVRLINDRHRGLTCTGLFAAQTLLITSDRDAKQDFEFTDPNDILLRLLDVPIQTWTYRNEQETRHIGPMAQDFKASFGVGSDDKHIATVDADGVALAAIQGLHRLVQEQDTEIRELKKRLMSLEEAQAKKRNLPSEADD
jgi:hypothetical protein